MKTVKVLLGNSDRQMNNLIEATVLDVCYNQAVAQFTRTSRVGEFIDQARHGGFHLIILAPDNLLDDSTRRASFVPLAEVVRAIRSIKSQHSTALLAVGVPAAGEVPLWEAGVDIVLRRPLDPDQLKSEVRRLWQLAEPVEAAEPRRWSLAEALRRSLQRLVDA